MQRRANDWIAAYLVYTFYIYFEFCNIITTVYGNMAGKLLTTLNFTEY